MAPWANQPVRRNSSSWFGHFNRSCFELQTHLSLTPKLSLPLVAVVSLNVVIFVALGWNEFCCSEATWTYDSHQLEYHKKNYSTYVIVVGNSGICVLDLMECQPGE